MTASGLAAAAAGLESAAFFGVPPPQLTNNIAPATYDPRMGRAYTGVVAIGSIIIAGCGEAKPRSARPEATVVAGSVVPGVALVDVEVPDDAQARVAGIVRGADPACASKTPPIVEGHRDAKGRDWYHARCGDDVLVIVGAGTAAAVAYVGEGAAWTLTGIVVHDLPGAPLVCPTVSWHIEEMLREGDDTICLREVDGALGRVFEIGDTSLADGTDSSFEVVAGPPDEIRENIDCEDCEVCGLEEDCTNIPPGVQRYVRRHLWNGAAFIESGGPTRR